MTPTSLFAPTPDVPPHDREDDPQHAPPPRRRGPSRGLAALLALTAVIGGVAGAGLLLLTGAGDSTSTTTITQAPATLSSAANETTGAGGLNARALYAGTAAGVVDITSRGVTESSGGGGSPFGGQGPSTATATGTGFVIDGKGNIVTAAHVVDGASSITVKFQDGTTRTAKLLGRDNATDVAVLSVDPSGLSLHPLALGSSASLVVGDQVAAIGDPFTYDRSMSTGIVSGLDRTISAPNGFTVAHAIQTDASLNPGNSGGPVLDTAGKVIGIVDQIATNGSTSATSSGVGFAVPIDLVRSELSQLEAGQTVKHAYFGVSTSDAGTATPGALIQGVTSGGPAADAGLRSGDIVTSIGTATIKGTNDLVAAIATHKAGDRVAVNVRRGSQTIKITVTLGTQPSQPTTSG